MAKKLVGTAGNLELQVVVWHFETLSISARNIPKVSWSNCSIPTSCTEARNDHPKFPTIQRSHERITRLTLDSIAAVRSLRRERQQVERSCHGTAADAADAAAAKAARTAVLV